MFFIGQKGNAQFHLTGSVPAKNAIQVDVNESIMLQFTDNVDPTTVSSALSVKSDQRILAGNVTVNNSSLAFSPVTPFWHGEKITVTVSTNLKSTGGTFLDQSFYFQFTTGILPSPHAPPVFTNTEIYHNSDVYLKTIVVADLDNDGDLDWIYGGNNGIGWFENTGGMSYVKNEITAPVNVIFQIKPIDIDNDQDIDLVISGIFGGIYLLTNDGSQGFETAILTAEDEQSVSLDVADFDSNGFYDIVYANLRQNAKQTSILYNQGSGVFVKTTFFENSSFKNHVGDIDNDGDPDIVQVSNNQLIYFINTDNSFSTPYLVSEASYYDLHLEDVEGDGDLDIITSESGALTLHVNNGSLQFNALTIASGTNYEHVDAGDFDGDHDIDIVLPMYQDFDILINDGSNQFSRHNAVRMYETTDPTSGTDVEEIGSADMDGDGDLDFFSITHYYELQWFENSSLSKAFPFIELQAGNLLSTSSDSDWGDYDNDGDLDLLMVGDANGIAKTALYENVNGVLEARTTSLFNVTNGSCDWGDYDNDGDLDIVIMGFQSYDFSTSLYITKTAVYANDQGVFTLLPNSLTQLPQTHYGKIRWADFNNDGRLDIVINAMWVSAIYSLENGSFQKRYQFPFYGVSSHGDVRTADYDGDGDLDIAVSGWLGNSELGNMLKVFRNDGQWKFSEAAGNFIGISGGSLNWADMDADGDLDLIASGGKRLSDWGGTLGSTVVYRNENGTFQSITNSGQLYYPDMQGSAATGDYNNDGTIDLVVTNGREYSGALNVYKNNGTGDLTDSKSELPLFSNSNVQWIDFDQDLDLDIFLSPGVLQNNTDVINHRPIPPLQVKDSIYNNILYVYWTSGNDAETPANALSYQLYVGTQSGEQDVLHSASELSTGFRKVTGEGIASGKSWKVENILDGTYFYGVQTVDGSFVGSTFSSEFQTTVFSINGADTVCVDKSYKYRAMTNDSYSWQINGGVFVDGQGTAEVTVTWDEPGSGWIKATNSLDKVNRLLIVIDEVPIPVISGNDKVCSIEEDYSVADTRTSAVNWSTAGGTIVKGQGTRQTTINWENAGQNVLTAMAYSQNKGCFVAAQLNIHVDEKPKPIIYGSNILCEGDTIQYTTTGLANNWKINGGTVVSQTNQSINVNWNKKGDGSVTLIASSSNNYCSTTISIPTQIKELPSKPFVVIQQGQIRSSSADTYQWYLDGKPISPGQGGTQKSVAIASSGTYSVEVFNSAGCSVFSDPMVIAGINEGETSFSIFPNPASEKLLLNVTSELSSTPQLSLFNLNGQLVKSQTLREGTAPIEVDISQLEVGSYYGILKDNSNHILFKFIKVQ